MEYRVLEQTDLELSNICLGSAGFGDKLTRERSFEILDAFVERGGNSEGFGGKPSDIGAGNS